jgi:hypothetical protein
MKKNAVFLLAFLVSGCWLKPIERPKPFIPEISKEAAKQVEMKAVSEAAQSVNMSVNEIKGYFLKNGAGLSDGINFFVLSSEKRFDEILGASAIETDISQKPDFKSKIAVVLSTGRLPQSYDIKIIRAYAIGSDVYVEYDFSQKAETSYYGLSAKVFEIEKPQVATNICFIDAVKNSKVMPLGNRGEYSPASVSDLIQNYTGIYKGTLPAADGPGISTVLVLSKDYTFNLKQIYLSSPDRVFETSGNWAPTGDLSSFVLNYDKQENERTAFRFIDKASVEQLDIYGEIINSGFYKLKK